MSDDKKHASYKSLSVTLTLSFLSVSVLVLLVSIFFDTYFNFQTQQKSIASQQRLIAQKAANTVENFIQEKLQKLETATQFANLIKANKEEQNLVLQKLLGVEPSFRAVILLDVNGNQLATASRVSNFALEKEAIETKNELLSSIKKKQNYISPVYIDQGTAEPKIIIAVPLKDIFGDVTGSLTSEINLKFMWDLVGNIQIGKNGVAYVVNQKGDLLAFHDTSRVLKGENLSKLHAVGEFVDHNKAPSAEQTELSQGIQNTTVISTFVPLGTPNWAVVVELPAIEAYDGVIQIFKLSILIIILSSVLAIISAHFLSKKITKPLTKLTEVAEKISQGDFSKRAEVASGNEVGRLAFAFNDMTNKLQELYAGLEKKVQEKTQQLQEEKANVEQKIIERTKQLSDEHVRLQASIDSLSIGYIMCGPDNSLVLINSAAENIMTLNVSSARPVQNVIDVSGLKGKIDITFIHNALIGTVNLWQQLEESRKNRKNIILKNIPYKMLYLNLYITPIVNKVHNEVIGCVLLIEDTTEQKVLERSRDEFFSIASHELRTPLTAIRGNASIITDYYSDEIKNPAVKEILSDIHESSIRLIDIVNDFLDLSRLEQGKIQYISEPFEIVKLCEEVLKEYDVTGSRKKLALEIDRTNTPLPLLYADKARLRQVIVNLIGNGIKFTTQGGIKISFAPSAHGVKLFVTDTGQGIPESNQKLLFRKFQQAESNILTRDYTKGTGLGLYISKIMMNNMGGEIALESSIAGKGSTFSITVPIATEAQKKEYATKPQQPQAVTAEKGGPNA